LVLGDLDQARQQRAVAHGGGHKFACDYSRAKAVELMPTNLSARGGPPRAPLRVLTIKQWAAKNSLSERHARRILKSGHGPKVTWLSERRCGIREDHDLEWLESRVR
jgi:hypothetical protein